MRKLLTLTIAAALLIGLSFTGLNKKIIIIDAGHGGTDNGATHNDLQEKDIVLNIAKKIKELNKDENIEILLTRDGDSYPSLADRSGYANKVKPDLLISLHMNKALKNTDKKGAEIYYQDNENSKNIASQLATSFDNCLTKHLNLHILRESTSPALLLELGFISNEDDRNYYSSEKGQTETAEKILKFVSQK
ncbi:N-acetylmuramoyl-L-alanine amidase [Soonwooa sp.]|uniref:N-acetylmuramoyl-L-alanine amidase family protein n=1 Tax=Soonwooa sp. TaxID=1938592 RepID=UPI002899E42F|nr:N-acetylmuramoyl-L-alanine amidase [Soonwooa sp.]